MITTRPTSFGRPKCRLLVICNDGDYFLRHRLYLVTHLISMGVDVTVVTGGTPISPDQIAGWEYIHMRIERFKFDLFGDIALMLRTWKIVGSIKPDAIHLITLKPAIFSGIASA